MNTSIHLDFSRKHYFLNFPITFSCCCCCFFCLAGNSLSFLSLIPPSQSDLWILGMPQDLVFSLPLFSVYTILSYLILDFKAIYKLTNPWAPCSHILFHILIWWPFRHLKFNMAEREALIFPQIFLYIIYCSTHSPSNLM